MFNEGSVPKLEIVVRRKQSTDNMLCNVARARERQRQRARDEALARRGVTLHGAHKQRGAARRGRI